MSVTQYIGSRYVPLFANPAEWDDKHEYEPLTIVIHEGNSYTSRQYVPVGIDIRNEKFWALTGNYNAQVEQYRREVQTVTPFDDEPTEGSKKGVTSDGLKKRFDDVQKQIDEVAPLDESPTENSAKGATSGGIFAAEKILSDKIDIMYPLDATPKSGSTKGITSDAVFNATDAITKNLNSIFPFDVTPTQGSPKGATSGGIKTYVDSKFPISGSDIKFGAMWGRFHHCVFIGDSWGAGFMATGGGDDLEHGLAKYLGDALGCTICNMSVSATGYATSTTPTYKTQVQNANPKEGNDAVDLVVIEGGQNDISKAGKEGGITDADVADTINAALSKFPHARIVVMNMPLSCGRSLGSDEDQNESVGELRGNIARKQIDSGATLNDDPSRVQIIDGCLLWGTALGFYNYDQYIGDSWHLKADGYMREAYWLAKCIYEGSDYWPNLTANAFDTNMPGSFQYPRVNLVNGIVNIDITLHVSGDMDTGTHVDVPWFAAPGRSFFFTGVCPSKPGAFLAVDKHELQSNPYVSISLQGSPLANDDWLFISKSWAALA